MRTVLACGMTLGLVAFLAVPALAGAPAPAPAPAPKAAPAPAPAPMGGALAVDSLEGASKLTISGQLRSRFELQNNMLDFNSGHGYKDVRDFVDTRIRLGLEFQLPENVSVFIQPQAHYIWGGARIRNTEDSSGDNVDVQEGDNFAVYQAYVTMHPEIADYATTLKIGRQELAFGSQMILGNNDRYEGLSFDALRLDVQLVDKLNTSLFLAKLVENDEAIVDNSATDRGFPRGDSRADTQMLGLWNTYTGFPDTTIDVYWVWINSEVDDDQGDAPLGYELNGNLHTLGARLKVDEIDANGHKFDFSIELATQLGNIAVEDATGSYQPSNADSTRRDVTDVYALETEFGYKPPALEDKKVRLFVGYDLASGNDRPGENKVQTFNPLFQDTGARLGESDLLALSNLQAIYVGATMAPMDKVTLGLSYWKFQAMKVEDAAGGSDGIPPLPSGTENDIADELDLFADYAMSKNVGMRLTYAYVDPADMIRKQDGFGNDPATRLFLTLDVKW